jgi:acetylornithine/succinyldiaminopimelate/putrescine aminotransferase
MTLETLSAAQRRARAEAVTNQRLGPSGGGLFGKLGIDLVIGRREGCHVWDIDGRRFLDVLCDGTTYNFGHRNPRILAAARTALDEVDIGCQFLASEARAALAERLIDLAPPGMERVYLAASGSEANDAALKAAFFATSRRGIVSIDLSFHGVTGLAVQAGHHHYAGPFGIQVGEAPRRQVAWNDLAAMEAALAPGDIAAVILETIPATAGWPMPAADYLAGVRRLCDAHGALMILDEIQTGLGRLGTLWGGQAYGVTPDIMTMAKGAGGGVYPLAYVLMNARAGAWVEAHPGAMPSTFGGSEIGCRVGLAVLELAAEPAFLDHTNSMADLLSERLKALAGRHTPMVAEVRQKGLAAALKLSIRGGGALLMGALYRRGVLAILAGFDVNVIQLKPPLVLGPAEVEELLLALDGALTEIGGQA